MVKKIILGFFITSLIMIGVFGLVGCDDDPLKSYKDLGKTEIQTYADAKGQDNYSTDDWAVICNTIATGKAAVDAAESTDEVDAAVTNTKAKISKVRKEGLGRVYNLQEAYDEGLLTVEDLQQIANYHNNETLPTDILSEDIISKFKELWVEDLHAATHTDANIDDVTILKYYGTYNGSVAFMVIDNFSTCEGDGDTFETAGILFVYSDLNWILVYK